MSDNLRPMLYGARYEADIADRSGIAARVPARRQALRVGDVIVADADLPDPHPGDVVVTPATGAYGYAMANNYNGVPRPPVVFVVRRRRARWSCAARRSRTCTPAMSDNADNDQVFRIGLLGHGTVGAAFEALLGERADAIAASTGRAPEITGVLTRSQGDFERDPRRAAT